MKLKLKKTLNLDFTLDSSEAIMFSKGGMHTFIMNQSSDDEDDNHQLDFSEYHEVKITFQLERNEQGRFDFITGEAEKNKQRVADENKST